MDRHGLLGREAPLHPETLSEVDRVELPIRGMPSRALALNFVWAAVNEPSFQDR